MRNSSQLEMQKLQEKIRELELELLIFRSGRLESETFVGSIWRNTFHRENCEWASYIRDRSLIKFDTHEEAVAAGYKPCKTCRA